MTRIQNLSIEITKEFGHKMDKNITETFADQTLLPEMIALKVFPEKGNWRMVGNPY